MAQTQNKLWSRVPYDGDGLRQIKQIAADSLPDADNCPVSGNGSLRAVTICADDTIITDLNGDKFVVEGHRPFTGIDDNIQVQLQNREIVNADPIARPGPDGRLVPTKPRHWHIMSIMRVFPKPNAAVTRSRAKRLSEDAERDYKRGLKEKSQAKRGGKPTTAAAATAKKPRKPKAKPAPAAASENPDPITKDALLALNDLGFTPKDVMKDVGKEKMGDVTNAEALAWMEKKNAA